MLEEQLASSRRRAEQVLDLENTILQLKQTINHLNIVSFFLFYLDFLKSSVELQIL